MIEYAGDLVEELHMPGSDMPVYARTAHGTYHFVVEKVERVEHEGEDVAVLVLKEVEW